MIRAILYSIVGILGIIQFIFLPVYFDISSQNVYVFAICSNCRAFLWLFSAIDLVIGIILVIDYAIHKDDTVGISEDVTYLFILIVSVVALILSMF